MAEYDNTNRGTLFRNDRRESDKHPQYTGSINVNGEEFWLSAWIKESRDGSKKFFSLSVKEKEQRGSKPQGSNVGLKDQLNDDIPFAPENR